jgi:hypothetical protein
MKRAKRELVEQKTIYVCGCGQGGEMTLDQCKGHLEGSHGVNLSSTRFMARMTAHIDTADGWVSMYDVTGGGISLQKTASGPRARW